MRPLVASVLGMLMMGACGGTSDAMACGRDVEEPLDPRSTQHLLPGAPEPRYSADPPTSGPHLASDPPQGPQHDPLPRPVQVALLERGGVLVQYRQLTADERSRLEALDDPLVVSAPNPSLPVPVVVTAWRHRMECQRLDMTAVSAFVARHRGHGPGTP